MVCVLLLFVFSSGVVEGFYAHFVLEIDSSEIDLAEIDLYICLI